MSGSVVAADADDVANGSARLNRPEHPVSEIAKTMDAMLAASRFAGDLTPLTI